MRQNPKNRSLEICLQQLQAGEPIEQILGAYPRWSAEFRPMLTAAQAILELADSVHVPQEDQSTNLHVFLNAASEMIPKSEPARRKRSLQLIFILLIVISVVTLISMQLFRISSDALPGDWLYGIKILDERISLAGSQNLKQRLSMEFDSDQARVEEVEILLQTGHVQMVEFSAALEQIDLENWRVGNVLVVIPADTRVVGDIKPGYYVNVIGETRPEGSVYARQVQMREYQLSGELQDLGESEWIVDGVAVIINAETSVRGTPSIGSKVNILALRSLESDLYARLVELELP